MEEINNIFEISEADNKDDELSSDKNSVTKKEVLWKILIILFLILDLMAITKPNEYSCKEMRHSGGYVNQRCDNYADLFFIALTSEARNYYRGERETNIYIGAFGIWFKLND